MRSRVWPSKAQENNFLLAKINIERVAIFKLENIFQSLMHMLRMKPKGYCENVFPSNLQFLSDDIRPKKNFGSDGSVLQPVAKK